MPPLPLHVPLPFGEVLLSQLSAPSPEHDGATLHQILCFFTQEPASASQRAASITALPRGKTQACKD